MSERILVMTVGGNIAPVVNAIKGNQPPPQRIVFIASTKGQGAKMGSDDQVAEIVDELAWTGEYQVAVTEFPDRLDQVWNCIEDVAAQFPKDAIVTANYTGGTKSMAAGLVLFALDIGWGLQLQAGARNDLERSTDQGHTRKVSLLRFRINSSLKSAAMLSQHGDYWGAAQQLTELLQTEGLSPETETEISAAVDAYRFQEALETYDFAHARKLLNEHRVTSREQSKEWGSRLSQFEHVLAWLRVEPEARPISSIRPALSLIQFLIDTAKSIATNRARYDDAFSRLYRATELLAQVTLRFAFDLKTGDLELTKLPEGWSERVSKGQNGRYLVGLMQAYELLNALNHPLGAYFEEHRNTLFDLLQYRNQSWLAHGFVPITQETWEEQGRKWLEWLEGGMGAIN